MATADRYRVKEVGSERIRLARKVMLEGARAGDITIPNKKIAAKFLRMIGKHHLTIEKPYKIIVDPSGQRMIWGIVGRDFAPIYGTAHEFGKKLHGRLPNPQEPDTPVFKPDRRPRRNIAHENNQPSALKYFVEMGRAGEWARVASFGKLADAKTYATARSQGRTEGAGGYYSWRVTDSATPRKKNPANPARETEIKRAKLLYLDFTGHEPAKPVMIDKPKFPDVLSVIGEIDGIMYTTVRDGQTEKYLHKFKKSARPLFAVSPDGLSIHAIGGSYVFGDRGIVDK